MVVLLESVVVMVIVEAFIEASTNCCIQYKHAFASFVPSAGNFFEKLWVLPDVEDFVITHAL